MATSDGISSEDWDVVHDLALEAVDASVTAAGETSLVHTRLLEWLDHLETKYGRLVSILATRADYLAENDPRRESLLLEAYRLAERDGDVSNLVELSHSLTEYYLSWGHADQAAAWFHRFESYVATSPDAFLKAESRRFRDRLTEK